MRFHVGMKKLPVYMMFHVAFISYRPTWNLRRHCIVFVQNVINSIVFSDVLKSLHCIALKISCRVCLHENFAPDMKSHVCLFDRHEIWPDMSFMSPVSCKRYEAFVRRPIWKKSHVGRHETSCKRPLILLVSHHTRNILTFCFLFMVYITDHNKLLKKYYWSFITKEIF